MSTVLPALRYSAEHEWVDDASPARIGISQVAADNLGDIVYVDLPEAGSTITAGEACGEIESTKSVSELYAPVTGTVVEVNAEAVDNPGLLNEDAYGAGWLFTVEVAQEGPLLSALEYAEAYGGELA
ncbi:glycine cleavage system protein GcvH [Georgenia sp. AZ-5]|uniref:glycine cleavage system protein GcvH n=1 Tax=Georgenia sp. AZ-5 TaxID=3367526 RepID=UPI003754ED0B